ncbi:TorD/DmsD family molecular chaperone [Mucispirillum schaedleri]|uniref:TorD/DmsD family molecular chaperone n=1 Tax=Mucispirillum schaedleri TaxID=248039 RepID=UPI001F59C242|nr:molecular chaperone TorD family protein [Mucispirillum schaedleri]
MESSLKSEIHSARGSVYLFLRNCLYDMPNETFYKMIEDMLSQLSQIVNGSENKDMKNGYNGMLNFINTIKSISGKELDELNLHISREYTSCLCLPGTAQQEESYYISEDHILKQESNDDMIKLFHKYGFSISAELQADYDNVCIELAFMSKLAYMSADTENKDEYYNLILEQLNFHKNHFDKWIYHFYDKLIGQKIIESKLYRYIAEFSKGFIREDKLLLEDLNSSNN